MQTGWPVAIAIATSLKVLLYKSDVYVKIVMTSLIYLTYNMINKINVSK